MHGLTASAKMNSEQTAISGPWWLWTQGVRRPLFLYMKGDNPRFCTVLLFWWEQLLLGVSAGRLAAVSSFAMLS